MTTTVYVQHSAFAPLVAEALIKSDKILAGCPPAIPSERIVDAEAVLSLRIKFDGKAHVRATEQDLTEAEGILKESRRRQRIVGIIKRIEIIRSALELSDKGHPVLVPIEEIELLRYPENHLS